MVDDLDKGGRLRVWDKIYLGPSLGWIMQQVTSIVKVTTGGTIVLDVGVTLVEVNSPSASPTIQLPSSVPYPGTICNPITIIDTGGNAQNFPITIVGSDGQTVVGLTSIQLTNNFGSFTLVPDTVNGGWTQQ